MHKLKFKHLEVTIDEDTLGSLSVLVGKSATKKLAIIWDEEATSLKSFIAVYYDKNIKELGDNTSFITVAFKDHGYVENPKEVINKSEIVDQYKIDLSIINRESGWEKSHAIMFNSWWPSPSYNDSKKTLDFGVILSDGENNIINKTINRIILTRYGHIEINYSLSEEQLKTNKDVKYYINKLDEVSSSINIDNNFSYSAINKETDTPSKFKIINLILTAEIF